MDKRKKTFIAFASGLILCIIPLLVLIGWQFDIDVLKRITPHLVAMNPMTAISFISLGGALLILSRDKVDKRLRQLAVSLCIFASLVGFLKLAELYFGVNVHIDRLLYDAKLQGPLDLKPNRMAPNTAFNFLIMGTAIALLLFEPRRYRWLIRVLSVLCIFSAAVAVTGYIYGVQRFYGVKGYTPMAIHTALLFLLLSIIAFRYSMADSRTHIRRSILASLILVLVLLTGVVWFMASSLHKTLGLENDITAMQKEIQLIQQVRTTMVDAETGQRGYLLTQDPHYLEPYTKATKTMPAALEELHISTSRDHDQAGNLAELETLVAAKIGELQSTIDAYQLGGLGSSLRIVDSNHGKELMDAIRKNSDAMEKDARGHLTTILAHQSRQTDLTLTAVVGGMLILVSGIFLVYYLLIDENGRRNVAESKLKEGRNRAERERSKLQAILSSIGDGVFAVDRGNTIVMFNEAAEKISGFTADEVLGTNFDKMLRFRDASGKKSQDDFIAKAQQGSQATMDHDTVLINKDGKFIPVADSAAPIVDIHGHRQGVIVVFRDVSVERQFEQALEESNARFEMAAKATSEIIYDLDLEKGILWWNEGLHTQFGYKEADKETSTLEWWSAHIHPDDAATINNQLDKLLKGSKATATFEYRFLKSDGEYAFVQDRGFIVRNHAHKPIRLIGSMLDVSQQKALERAKDEFISIVSHQLRTPLTAIRLFAEMLADGQAGKLTSNQKMYVDNVQASTIRMIKLVGDILNVSRIELGRVKIDPSPQDINKLINTYVEEVRPLAEQKGVALNFTPQSTISSVSVDPIMFGQIVHNLLTNAIRYSNVKNGKVDIAFEKSSKGYALTVRDNGIGIPRSAQNQIFGRFYRAENAIMAEGEGTGLGLYLIKMIVQSAGGKVWFESTEGEGTTFYVRFLSSGMKAKAGDRTLG